MKKIKWFIVVLVAVVFLGGFVANTPERRATRFYNKNEAELNHIIERYISEDALSYSHDLGTLSVDMDDVHVNAWNGEHLMVEFFLFSPMGKYCGIYWSADDVPLAFQNMEESIIQVEENRWEWQGYGDNHGLTTKIDENWYYFEASF